MFDKTLSLSALKEFLDTYPTCAFVVGNPIEHSLSPLMHNTASEYHGLDLVYSKVLLKESEITSLLPLLSYDSFVGCNITIPYKETFLEVVDHVDSLAESIGAINTIHKSGSLLQGYNTDLYGFMQPLRQYEDELEGSNAIVFGSGGAAKAVIVALEQLGLEHVIVVSRRPTELDFEFESIELTFASYENWNAFVDQETFLIINTTPFGQGRLKDQSPVHELDEHLLADRICYDLVYGKEFTPFLRQALNAKAYPIDGLEMLINQAAAAFEIWTNLEFPINEVRKALRTKLNE